MKDTKVLISGHGQDRNALDASRRLVAHTKLILVTSSPNDPDLASLCETEGSAGVSVDVHGVDPFNLMACLETAHAILMREKGNEVRIHVAGGPNLVTSALLLAAFQHGVDSFYCHKRGVSHLPVAVNTKLDERFTLTERIIITKLPSDGAIRIQDLVSPGLALPIVRGALLRLRKLGIVTANAESAGLTSAGIYYQRHFYTADALPRMEP